MVKLKLTISATHAIKNSQKLSKNVFYRMEIVVYILHGNTHEMRRHNLHLLHLDNC